MKKSILALLLITVVGFALAQSIDQTFTKLLVRTLAPQTQLQFDRLEAVWNWVDRPAKTNFTLKKIEIVRTVNGGTTNFTVRAVENVRVKMVEN